MSAAVEQITATLTQARHPQAKHVAKPIAERLKQPHLVANAVTTRTKAPLMLVGSRQLLPLLEQIREYEKEITALFLTHPDHALFESLPRAGQRLAPRRLSEIGEDRSRDLEAGSLQALGGTWPVLFQSGMDSKAHRRLGCIKPLRNAMPHFAKPRTQRAPWARDDSQRKRAEGKSHPVAVRALANVWVRIIFALWQHHQCYQTATFEQAQHQHARRAA